MRKFSFGVNLSKLYGVTIEAATEEEAAKKMHELVIAAQGDPAAIPGNEAISFETHMVGFAEVTNGAFKDIGMLPYAQHAGIPIPEGIENVPGLAIQVVSGGHDNCDACEKGCDCEASVH